MFRAKRTLPEKMAERFMGLSQKADEHRLGALLFGGLGAGAFFVPYMFLLLAGVDTSLSMLLGMLVAVLFLLFFALSVLPGLRKLERIESLVGKRGAWTGEHLEKTLEESPDDVLRRFATPGCVAALMRSERPAVRLLCTRRIIPHLKR